MNSQNSRIEPGWGPLAVLMGGIFMVVLDFFIVNVALPSMQRDLHASSGRSNGSSPATALTFRLLLITAGRARRPARPPPRCSRSGWLCSRSPRPLAAPAADPSAGRRRGCCRASAPRWSCRSSSRSSAYVRRPAAARARRHLRPGDGPGRGQRTADRRRADRTPTCPASAGAPASDQRPDRPRRALALSPRLLPDRRARRRRFDLVGAAPGDHHSDRARSCRCSKDVASTGPLDLASLAGAVVAGSADGRPERECSRGGGRRPLVEPEAFRSRTVRSAIAASGPAVFVGMASYFLVLALYLQNGRGLGALSSGRSLHAALAVPLHGRDGQPASRGRRSRPLDWFRRVRVFSALGRLALLALRSRRTASAGPWSTLSRRLALAGLGMGIALTGPDRPSDGRRRTDVRRRGLGRALDGPAGRQRPGVAVVGMVFFGAVGGGYDHALEWSLVVLAATTAGVALLGTLLRPRAAAETPEAEVEAPALAGSRTGSPVVEEVAYAAPWWWVEEVALRPSRNHRGATS